MHKSDCSVAGDDGSETCERSTDGEKIRSFFAGRVYREGK